MPVIISSHRTTAARRTIRARYSWPVPATMHHPTEDIIMKHHYFATEYIAEYKERAPMQTMVDVLRKLAANKIVGGREPADVGYGLGVPDDDAWFHACRHHFIITI